MDKVPKSVKNKKRFEKKLQSQFGKDCEKEFVKEIIKDLTRRDYSKYDGLSLIEIPKTYIRRK